METTSGPSRHTIEHLAELVEAIDRRLPQVARAGETAIATAAAALRAEALKRIAELEAESTGQPQAGP
jgi:hypothetical protein